MYIKTTHIQNCILWKVLLFGDTNFSGCLCLLKPRKFKIQRNRTCPFIVSSSVLNHEFKNTWNNAFCRTHENRCQRIKVFSQYHRFSCIHIANRWVIVMFVIYSIKCTFIGTRLLVKYKYIFYYDFLVFSIYMLGTFMKAK